MNEAYEFDFSKMTMGDIKSLASGDFGQIFLVLDRVTVGGICDIPVARFREFEDRFNEAFAAWRSSESSASSDDDALNDLLRGIRGL